MRKPVLRVVAATWLFSFVGLFAKLIPLSPGRISLGRAVFAFASMGLYLLWKKGLPGMGLSRQEFRPVVVLGLLMCGNWYFYFRSIQASTVAVGVLSLFTYPLLTTLLEPLFFKERYRPVDVLTGMLVVAGVFLIVPEIHWRNTMAQGVAFGLLAALSLALRNILSRGMVARRDASVLMLWQFGVAALFFLPSLLSSEPIRLDAHNLLLFLAVGAGFTTLSQTLFISSLKSLSTSFASILVSLQPVYTILLAFLILHEVPTMNTVFGGALILAAVGVSVRAHGLAEPEPRRSPE